MIEILYKNKDFVVVKKPPNIPSQKDLSGDDNAMTLCSQTLENMGENPDLWLVHRLDRTVGGVLCFARNKKACALLSEEMQTRSVEKEYLAVVEGECSGGVLEDYIYKDSKQNKAFTVDGERKGVKHAELEYVSVDCKETEKGKRTLVRVQLKTGRFHQIRVQFSSRGLPIVGDGKYGSRDKGTRKIALFSTKLVFQNRKLEVSAYPDSDEYPWSLFDKKYFEGK